MFLGHGFPANRLSRSLAAEQTARNLKVMAFPAFLAKKHLIFLNYITIKALKRDKQDLYLFKKAAAKDCSIYFGDVGPLFWLRTVTLVADTCRKRRVALWELELITQTA